MVLRTVVLASKRVPTIRFRFGGNAGGSSATTSISSSASSPSGGQASGRQPAIEDYELPARYSRKGIDQFEIEYINRGGRE